MQVLSHIVTDISPPHYTIQLLPLFSPRHLPCPPFQKCSTTSPLPTHTPSPLVSLLLPSSPRARTLFEYIRSCASPTFGHPSSPPTRSGSRLSSSPPCSPMLTRSLQNKLQAAQSASDSCARLVTAVEKRQDHADFMAGVAFARFCEYWSLFAKQVSPCHPMPTGRSALVHRCAPRDRKALVLPAPCHL